MSKRPAPAHALYAPRYWLSWVGVMLWRVLAALPFWLSLGIGRLIGRILYSLLPRRRRIAATNLALCFPAASKAELEQLGKAHFASLGAALAEAGLAWWGSRERVLRRASIRGLENLEAAAQNGRGVILLTGHFTPLELTGRMLGEAVPGITAIYRANENAVLDAVTKRGRERSGHTLRKQQTREIVRTLRAGRMIWYAPDQHHRGAQSAQVPFFGRPAATSLATPRLAELGRAAVVPYLPRRLPNGAGYEVRLLPALEDFPSEDGVRDLERINEILEGWIREQPEQYLWIHRRFKPAQPGMPDPYAAPGA